MLKKLIMICLAVAAFACQPKKQEEQSQIDSTAVSYDSTVLPKLTDQQQAEGWRFLFDGQSMNGWRTFKNKPQDSWEVKDGTLHCKAFVDGRENQRADLMTTSQFENFKLAFDWKISPQGNSGVIYRVTEEYDQPYKSGPEYQVLDDGGYPGETKETNMSGCNYDMHAIPKKKLNPPGEWNSSMIVANLNHVEHWLNGEKVVEYEIMSDDWRKRKAASKWKDEAGYGMATRGYIDLQDHNHEVWFRNIMIKEF